MSYTSNSKIIAPVGLPYDMQQAIGTNECDLGSDCRHANVNMWAKYKPVVRVNLLDTTGQLDANKEWKPINGTGGLGNAAWFRSDAGNFGITPAAFQIGTTQNRTIDALDLLAATVKASTDGLNGWVYTQPRGLQYNEPYRMIDFNGYNANAPRPVVRASLSESNVFANETSVWQISLDIMGSAWNDVADSIDARDYLRLKDILPNAYFGIAIFRKDSNNVYHAMAWATGNIWYGTGVKFSGEGVTLGDHDVVATFVDGHTYYVLPVLFGEQLPQVNIQNNPTYGLSKQPLYDQGGQPYVWSIPNTTFIPFTTEWKSTANSIALPKVTPMEIGQSGSNGYYNGRVQLDSTPAGYTGGGTQQLTAEYALVTESWHGSLSGMSANEYVAGSHGTWTGTVPADTVTTIADFRNASALIGLSLQQMYRWVIVFADDTVIITLRQPYIPST